MKQKYLLLSMVILLMFFLWTFMTFQGTFLMIDSSIYNYISLYINDFNTLLMKIITFFGSSLFIISVVIILLFFSKKHYLKIILMFIGEIMLNNFAKIIIKRDRPNILPLVIEKSFSYPSGHAMISTFFYFFLIYFLLNSSITKNKKILLSFICLLFIFLICLSRIYLGVHYFSDIIGGILLGLSYFYFCFYFYQKKRI